MVIHWTAPADNGETGGAAGYDLRYQPYTQGPINTDQEWQSATRATNEPLPSPPGHADSTTVGGLAYGTGFYFCIRAYDNAANYSAMSNSPLLVAGDTTGYNYLIGDVNNNGFVNGIDLCYMVSYFKGRVPPPVHMMSADVNGNCTVNGIDVVYFTLYLKGGSGPIRGNC